MRNKLKMIILLAGFLTLSFNVRAEDEVTKQISLEDVNGKVEGIDETVNTLVSDVSTLKKLKISGYFQLEYNKLEASSGLGVNPYNAKEFDQSGFRVRRGRIKFTYDAGLSNYVFSADYSNKGFEIKDFYMTITDPWTKNFELQAGIFNRPNYEVEYSSSSRESMERSKVIATLYPKERDLGAMVTFKNDDWFKFQLAAFNNTYKGDLSQFWPNYNDAPLYYMARITKDFAFPDLGLSIDLGAHARLGNVIANVNKVIESENYKVDSTTYKVGDKIGRNWFGAEAQIYWDFLGGMKLMGEYIMGSNTDEPSTTIRKRDFAGFYAMLVKNITEEWQFAAKYDGYNPNTAIAESDITKSADLSINTLGVGIHNYTFQNARISLWYDMPKTTIKTGVVDKDPIDNALTLRLQYKF
jgi:hypothetical protein